MSLTKCDCCIEAMECHFCSMTLIDEPPRSDDEAWCDWVITTTVPNPDRVAGDEVASTYTPPPERVTIKKHIIAHAYCAEGQLGIERG